MSRRAASTCRPATPRRAGRRTSTALETTRWCMSSDSSLGPSSRNIDPLPLIQIENLHNARFRCVFPECGGLCCKTGRPSVTVDDVERIEEAYDKVEPLMRADVRRDLDRS